MTDFVALEAACRKKIAPSARKEIEATIEAERACGSGKLASALEFLLEREGQIDDALSGSTHMLESRMDAAASILVRDIDDLQSKDWAGGSCQRRAAAHVLVVSAMKRVIAP